MIPIRTATNTALKPIKVATGLGVIAICPNGRTAYVARDLSTNDQIRAGVVIAINTATNKIMKAIKVGTFPRAMAIMP